jgi:hypothetical protein
VVVDLIVINGVTTHNLIFQISVASMVLIFHS